MQQYVIDQLRESEIERIKGFLEKNAEKSELDNLFWLQIPDDLLSSIQCEHRDCWPFCAGIEVTDDAVIFEMLVRSRKKIRCKCIGYATQQQRQFILNFCDKMLSETEVQA